MPIKLPEPPAGSDAILNEVVAAGARRRPGVAAALSENSDISLAGPHRVFAVPRDALIRGDLLAAATPVAWRYLIVNQDSAVASAELIERPSGELVFSELNHGAFAQGTADVLNAAEQLDEVRERDFELRLLRIPSVYFVALWLRSDSADLILPLAPAPAGLEAGRRYTPDEILSVLRPRAVTNAELDARGQERD
jgi:hypothetical protein